MYPAESTIFKQHKLIHYLRILKSSGPFLYQSVLKYEIKHIFIKHIADNKNNFKNICYTIAVRHQLNQFLDWRDSVSRKSERFPNEKVVTVSDELAHCFYPEVFPNNEVFESRSVFIQGTRYLVDDMIILSLENADPFKKKIFFSSKLKLEHYEHHSRSFLVTQSQKDNTQVVRHKELPDFHPLSLHHCFLVSRSFSHVGLHNRLVFNTYFESFSGTSD